MTPNQYVDYVAAESERFAELAAGDLDLSIEHLGWTVRELVAHLGGVYAFVTANTTNPSTELAMSGPEGTAPDGAAIIDWFAERRDALLGSLRAADPAVPASTFAGTQTVGWWIRRMASETTVHRWDAEAATAAPDAVTPIASDLAADAVDEYLSVGLQFSSRRPDRVYPAESLHLHRSDGEGEWMLVADGQGGVTVTHEHGKGDAAVRGTASELLLWVWGRPTTDITIFGDGSVASAWQALAP